MNSLLEYFHTDWQSMTANDWVGTILTVLIFLLMIGAYVQVFRPANRERLEARKFIPFADDEKYDGERNGGK